MEIQTWEATVISMNTPFRWIVGNVKLTFEEFTIVLMKVETCLNSRPLISLSPANDGIEALTPGHFLIGRPLEMLPESSFLYCSLSLIRQWHLCQALVRHFGNNGPLNIIPV